MEILDISEFKVEDGVLNINIKRDEKNKSVWEQIDDIKIAPKLDVFISMKEVNALNVYGNGKIITENSISSIMAFLPAIFILSPFFRSLACFFMFKAD